MTRMMQARLIISTIGIVVWIYGLVRDESTVRLVGIAMLALSLILRFAPKRADPGAGTES